MTNLICVQNKSFKKKKSDLTSPFFNTLHSKKIAFFIYDE